MERHENVGQDSLRERLANVCGPLTRSDSESRDLGLCVKSHEKRLIEEVTFSVQALRYTRGVIHKFEKH